MHDVVLLSCFYYVSCQITRVSAGKAQKYLWRPVEQQNGTCLVPFTIGTPVSHPERSRPRRKQILNCPFEEPSFVLHELSGQFLMSKGSVLVHISVENNKESSPKYIHV
ncbi:unnamed protein product [Bursaphelenchus xylophilus]|uniref:(pine wood nematode) hypothetical protein n=1 Tax=Bursaphelenchus xylophilus TaxID=6326 RepID=A0A7I8WVG9_BURXY|nr:unnamed protein product [Bursaphelenchus xylophilus]CAG9117342.1 unnamed protein product [Bursaphelenchus xylophilus]